MATIRTQTLTCPISEDFIGDRLSLRLELKRRKATLKSPFRRLIFEGDLAEEKEI